MCSVLVLLNTCTNDFVYWCTSCLIYYCIHMFVSVDLHVLYIYIYFCMCVLYKKGKLKRGCVNFNLQFYKADA